MTIRWGLVLVVGVLALLASCSDDRGREGSRKPTTTTNATDQAATSAVEACRYGDTSSNDGTAEAYRRALIAEGREVEGLSENEIFATWAEFAESDGIGRWSDLGLASTAEVLRESTQAAARAAALDPRFEALHRGLSNYVSYLASPVGGTSSSEDVMEWFEDIRLGCERARALDG